ncbi:DUF5995 family protein [Sorangium sp. So ce1389]|uniref:DUF5995 family protein n=1 Tax=Sorangium sp. So ce1389 TaxID=3133336 RepID=UPI003F60AA9F
MDRRLGENLDDVIERLDDIIERSVLQESRFGYFAALYRRVTAAVRDKVRAGFFSDGAQMERFDVAFANRYFAALDRHRAGEPGVGRAWTVAFDACARTEPIILQHIYLGMNAHLLVDLGIAAAETCPGDQIRALRCDFLRINDIVASLMRDVDRDVGRASPWVGALDRFAGGAWGLANNAVLRGARELAWSSAVALAPLDARARGQLVERIDARAAWLAARIVAPVAGARGLARAVRARELDEPSKVIRLLQGRDV